MNQTTKALLKAPPVEWAGLVERWQRTSPGVGDFPPPVTRATMGEVIQELDGLIQSAARLRGYLDGRYGHGCGDQGHADAVKGANKLIAKIRKALGFTFPNGNEVTF